MCMIVARKSERMNFYCYYYPHMLRLKERTCSTSIPHGPNPAFKGTGEIERNTLGKKASELTNKQTDREA